MGKQGGCPHVCMANVSPLAGVSGLGRHGVKGGWGLDDTHYSSPGLTKKDERLSCPSSCCHLGLFQARWLLHPEGTSLTHPSISLTPVNQFSFVLPQPRPGNTDQESEEQEQFRNIFRQIAGDVSASKPNSHRCSSPGITAQMTSYFIIAQ